MSLSHCEKEPEVLAALRSGELGGGLRRHVDGCTLCADVILVQRYIGDLSAENAVVFEPSAAGRVWWKAERQARLDAVQRATRPIAVLRQAAWALAAMGLAVVAWFSWPSVLKWLAPLAPSLETARASAGLEADTLRWGGVALLSFLVFGIYNAWAEE